MRAMKYYDYKMHVVCSFECKV